MSARALWGLVLPATAALMLWASGSGNELPLHPSEPPRPAPFVPSMSGTQPDGKLSAAADGLRIDAELRHLFDYYLSALGEAELPAIRAGIELELSRRLQPAAAASAKRLLGQYLAYKRALAEAEASQGAKANGTSLAEAARGRLFAMQALRKRFFTPAESAGLFGDTDARDLDGIARLELVGDKSLTPAQRQERMAQLDRNLPPALQEERSASQRVLKLEEQVEAARSGGASEDDVFRLRARALDPQAASRLAQLDHEQAEWLRRIAEYRSASSNLGANQVAIQQLRDSLFTPGEQKRLGAYE